MTAYKPAVEALSVDDSVETELDDEVTETMVDVSSVERELGSVEELVIMEAVDG